MTQGREAPKAGGLNEGSIYLGRPADRALAEALKAGVYCQIVGPRQIGKSGLMSRVARRLSRGGVATAEVDLALLTGAEDLDGWYFGLVDQLVRGLGLPSPLSFWDAPHVRKLTPATRWTRYLTDVVLSEVEKPIVVFVDELQALAATKCSPRDFLSSLGKIQRDRDESEALRRLTFCLASASALSDFVDDESLGHSDCRQIRLEDFSRTEISGLRAALGPSVEDPDAVLDAIFEWTDGHPYMTTHACAWVAGQPIEAASEAEDVTALVTELFLSRPFEDPALAYSARAFSARGRSRRTSTLGERLDLYGQILRDGEVWSGLQTQVSLELELSGIVKSIPSGSGRTLVPRNRIYRKVFDGAWLHSQSKMRLFAGAMLQWVESERSSELLLRGEPLQQAVARSKEVQLSADERDFLDRSLRAHHDRVTAEHSRKRKHVAQVGLLALLAVVGVSLAVVQYARSEVRIAQEREAAAKRAQQEAVELQASVDERVADAEERTALAQEAMRRANTEAQTAEGQAAAAYERYSQAKQSYRAIKAASDEAHESSKRAQEAAAETHKRARKAAAEAEAAMLEREEMLKQAKDLSGVTRAAMRTALTRVQVRAAKMARNNGRLQAEVQALARDLDRQRICQLVVEAGLGGGVQISRMIAELKEQGVELSPSTLSRRVQSNNTGGKLCPGWTSWPRARQLLIENG